MCMANRLQIGPLLPKSIRQSNCVFKAFSNRCMTCDEYLRCSAEEEFKKPSSL